MLVTLRHRQYNGSAHRDNQQAADNTHNLIAKHSWLLKKAIVDRRQQPREQGKPRQKQIAAKEKSIATSIAGTDKQRMTNALGTINKSFA